MNDARRMIGSALVTLALVLAISGWLIRNNETDRVEDADNVFLDGDEQEPDYVPAYFLWGAGGVLFISGTVVLASVRSDSD